MKSVKKALPPKTPANQPARSKKAATILAAPSKTPLREWVALIDARAKAKPGESDLPDYKIKALPAGTRLHAVLSEETGDHWRIKDGVIDGKKLPRNIKILEKAEWRLVPVDGAAAPATSSAATFDVEPLPPDPPPEATATGGASAAEIVTERPAARLKLCLRGAGVLAPHLKEHFDVTVEGTFTYHGWSILPVARAVAVHDQAASPAGRALLEKLPGIPPGRFTSAINTGSDDVYVLSFASEVFPTLFRSKSTGMVLPLNAAFINAQLSANTAYADIADKAAAAGVTEDVWDFLQHEFAYIGPPDEQLLAGDLNSMFALLRGKTVIVLMLNTTAGNGQKLLARHGKINALVRSLVEAHGLNVIETDDFVRGAEDLAQPDGNGAMFKPKVYAQIAARITEIIDRAALQRRAA